MVLHDMLPFVEFDTIHHYFSLEEKFEACLCSSLDSTKIN